MELGIIGIIVAILIILLLIRLIKFGLKIVLLTVLVAVVALTIWICCAAPDMHEPFSMNTIEYLFNINKDGSVSTTKQVTSQTVINHNGATKK